MIRLAAFAGQFYPENKRKLGKMIDGFLNKAEASKIDGKIFGLLLPHAAYSHSGQVAAAGFKAIIGKKFNTVVIIGDSHYERFDGVAVFPEGSWGTPLGRVKVDEKLAKEIISYSPRFFRRDSAHLWEHSIEVQLPFLQKILKNFKILPIVFGSENKDWRRLAKAISVNMGGRKVLIIASVDLSHYLSHKKAKETDRKTLKNILNFRISGLEVCAVDSAKTLIGIAKSLKGQTKLLKYANSGDTVRKKPKVVGYGAVVFYRQ